ncbi:MAG: response regulator transcription factor [Eubacterium sp.]|nr:response regulator transcription factor [Eubacterium sp.]
MVKIAVVDEHMELLDAVICMIQEYAALNKKEIKAVPYRLAQELFWDLEERKEYYDIYLLDAIMGETGEYYVAQHIRELYQEPPFLVVISTDARYSIKGYEYHVSRYILKSQWQDELPAVLDELCGCLDDQNQRNYIIETANHVEKICYKDIYYVYVERKYTYFCTVYGISRVRKTLSEVFAQLEAKEFVYLDKSCIVNLRHIVSIDKLEVRLSSGEKLTVSRTQVRHLRNSIKEYWGQA